MQITLLNKKINRGRFAVVTGAVVLTLLSACSSRDERKVEYLNRAQQHFAAQNYDKARIDVRNALQIDESYAAARYLYAQLFELEQNWQQMVGNLRAALEADETHIDARLKYATLLLAARQFDEADEQADRVITQAPDTAEAYAVKAASQFRRGNNLQAIALAQEALSKDPKNVSAVAVLTEVYKTENPELALASIERGLAEQSDTAAFELMRISVFEANNQIEQAAQSYQALITEFPNNLYYHYRFVTLLETNGRHSEAANLIRTLAAAKPDEVQLKLWLVQYLVNHEDLLTAEQTLRGYIADHPDQFDLQVGLGTILVAQGKSADARQHYLSLIASAEDSELAQRSRMALAQLEFREGNTDQGNRWIDETLTLEPENPDALTQRANQLLRQGDFPNAVAQARSVLRNRPDSVQALGILAQAHLRSDSIDLARDNFQQILVLEPQNQQALTTLADLAMKANNADEAQQYAGTALRANPENSEAARVLVAAYTAQGDTRLALEQATALANSANNKLLGTYLLGAVHFASKNYDQAIDQFTATLAIEPRVNEALTGLVRAQLAAGNKQAAFEFLTRFAQDHPEQDNAPVLLGNLYSQDGKPELAVQQYERALSNNPQNVSAYERLGDLSAGANNLEAALATYTQGLEQLPDNPSLLMRKAQMLERLNRFSAARVVYEQVLVLNDQLVVARNNLAVLLTDQDGSPEALERALVLMRPYTTAKAPALLDTLGWVYHRLGDQEQATRYLQAALDNGGTDPMMHFHLASAQAAAGDTAAALKSVKTALASDSPLADLTAAQALLSRLQ